MTRSTSLATMLRHHNARPRGSARAGSRVLIAGEHAFLTAVLILGVVVAVLTGAGSARAAILAEVSLDGTFTHGPTMRTAEYNGLTAGLAGFGPDWDSWKPPTRGEVAQILWNLMMR